MPLVSSIVNEAEAQVGDHKNILRLYRLVARINSYWADRIEGVREMREVASDSTIPAQARQTQIIKIEKTLLRQLAAIRKDYVRAYLRTNRLPMLPLIEARFEQQAAQLESGTNQMIAGNVDYNQLLPSSFIYFPGSRPYTGGPFKVDSATFLRTIDLAGIPEKPEIQLIGDTYCKLFVNGKFVGDVTARRTLTWDVDFKRVKLFNIKNISNWD